MQRTGSVRGMTATDESRTDESRCVASPSLVMVEGSKMGSLKELAEAIDI